MRGSKRGAVPTCFQRSSGHHVDLPVQDQRFALTGFRPVRAHNIHPRLIAGQRQAENRPSPVSRQGRYAAVHGRIAAVNSCTH